MRKTLVYGFGTLIIREFFLKLISLLGQIFLARLLIPSDFGIYAIIVFVISFFSLFTDIGLSLAIIQKNEDVTQEELSGVFAVKMGLTIALVLVVWLCAPFTKLFYPSFNDANIFMVRIFSLTLLTTSLRAVPVALLERNLKYQVISMLDVYGVFVYYVSALGGALLHLGVWSFIYGTLAKEIAETIILYYFYPFLPRFSFSLAHLKKMIKFGIYIQGNALVNVLNNSLTPVIGGRMSGPYAVGLLDFAFNIASLPIIIAQNFGRVAFAGYARIQNEEKVLFQTLCQSISMLAIILYIFPVLLLGLGNEIVPVVFSAKWVPALPALYWYSVSAFLLPIIASLGQGILVIGKSKEIFWTSLATILCGWIAAIIFIKVFGFVGIAMTFLFICLSFSLCYIVIFQKADFTFPLLSLLFPKLFVALISLVVLFGMNSIMQPSLLFFSLKLVLVAFLYAVLMFHFAKKESRELFHLIRAWLFPN